MSHIGQNIFLFQRTDLISSYQFPYLFLLKESQALQTLISNYLTLETLDLMRPLFCLVFLTGCEEAFNGL